MSLRLPLSVALALVSFVRAQSPTPYCTAGTSTNGCTPSIFANVQPNTANTAGCVITTSGVEGQKQGLSFYGVNNAGFIPAPWGTGSTSFRCVKAPTKRISAPVSSGGVAGQCDGSLEIDWDAFQNANPTSLGNPWNAGQSVFVQSWYRDSTAPKTSNLSNALELTLRVAPPTPCVSTIPGMVAIPAGTFAMGANVPIGAPYCGYLNEQPVHGVAITYCSWMGQFEVTQAEYTAIMGANPSYFQAANNPVERTGWSSARAYCAALTARQSAAGNVPVGYQYRLPTEAEWERACRAGTTTEFNVGPDLLCSDANFGYWQHSNSSCNSNSIVPVGNYFPNAWGLHDMHGNVFEWRLDPLAAYSASTVTDPFVTGGPYRVLRGGGWSSSSDGCRSARRFGGDPSDTFNIFGFRVVFAPIRVP